MRNIYERAEHTLIWLGKDDPHAKAMFEFLFRFKDLKSNYEKQGESWKYGQLGRAQREALQISHRLDTRWPTSISFLMNPWFTRVWIVQELAVSKRPILISAPFEKRWDDFMSIIGFLFKVKMPFNDNNGGFERIHRLNGYRRGVQLGEREPLFNLRFACTDPRDTIYALLGLAELSRSDLMVEPDYTVSTEDLDLRISTHMFPTTVLPPLMDISRSEQAANTPNIPSWFVDWRPDRIICGFSFSQYESSPYHRPADVSFSRDGKSISLPGSKVDRVKVLGDVFEWLPNHFWQLPRWEILKQTDRWAQSYKEAESICNTLSSHKYALTGETMKQVYLQTLIAGRHCSGDEALMKYFEHWDRTTGRLYRRVLSKQSWPPFLCRMSTAISLAVLATQMAIRNGPPPERFQSFQADMQSAFLNRRFCCTATAYIGLLPDSAQQDDEIFLLKGCKTPMVLRASALPGQWKLIGPCYLHGAMQGQLWDEEKCHNVWLL